MSFYENLAEDGKFRQVKLTEDTVGAETLILNNAAFVGSLRRGVEV